MNKTILSVTAFLLSANLVHAQEQNLNNISSLPSSVKPVLSTPQGTAQYDFQKWVRAENLIGKKLVLESKNENEITLQKIKNSLPDSLKIYQVRIIKNGMAVTMEYTDTRINMTLDEHEVISRVYIG